VTDEPIRVLVADDHAIVRTGIRHVLESGPGFTVVAEASTGAEALELASSLHPDVTVLDISMPGDSGLRVVAELRRRSPETQVLILSMHDNTEYVLESLRAGAHGTCSRTPRRPSCVTQSERCAGASRSSALRSRAA
jgi:DNA-binding NarL/FixJ family response regulator